MAEPRLSDSLSDDLNNLALAAPQPKPLDLCCLPTELLDAIAAVLDQQSLCALVLTCKATKDSSSQALYATYINRDAPSKAPFHLFLRTLCESSQLAAMVRALDIRGWRSEWEAATGSSWAGVTKVLESDGSRSSRTGPLFVSVTRSATKAPKPLKLFEETAVKLGLITQPLSSSTPALQKSATMGSSLTKDEDFVRLLRHNVEDAQVVLMLALLPNLSKLCIDGMPPFPTLDWYHFLKKSASAPRRLRELYIHGHQHVDGCSLYTMNSAFLELVPSLERLCLTAVNLKTPRHVQSLLSDKKLREFIALEAEVGLPMLQTMLSGHRLTRFLYKPALGNMTNRQEKQCSEDRILDCLKDSLQSLLDLTVFTLRPSYTSRIAECSNLEVLEMPYQHGFFTSQEADSQSFATAFRRRIPNSLSTLSFRFVAPSEDLPIAMETLAELRNQGEFPKLKTVRLNFRCYYSASPWLPLVPYDDMAVHARKRFGNILKNAGLQLELEQTD
jgi:hypothetical protein